MNDRVPRRILTLAWEYPPKVIGGLARHAGYLSRALAEQGHRITVLTQGDPALPPEQDDGGVRVLRLPVHEPRPRDFTGWVKRLNFEMVEKAIRLYADGERFDVIHAHDWLAAYAGKTLKHGLAVPLVATVHATEYGRNNGLHNDLQRYISNVEWSLTYEGWRIICCSRFMEEEIHRVFQTPLDKIRVVPNGVHMPNSAEQKGDLSASDRAFRRRYAGDEEPLLFFMGRIVYEKGLHVLLDALPAVLARLPNLRLVVAGDGPLRGQFERQARQLGIADNVTFYGFADDDDRDRFLRGAQAAVFPSLYEPFGIVALEGMAADVPVIVGDVGGFAEIVSHRKTGLLARPGDASALAEAIIELLTDEELSVRLRKSARREVEQKYSWSRIASATADIYDEVLSEYVRSRWPAGRGRHGERSGLIGRTGESSDRGERTRVDPAAAASRYTETGVGAWRPSVAEVAETSRKTV